MPRLPTALSILGAVALAIGLAAVHAPSHAAAPFRAADSTSATVQFGAWQELPPPNRRAANLVYDAQNDRLLLFGGVRSFYGGPSTNDVWTIPLSGTGTWKLLRTSGVPPAPHSGAAAVYDPIGRRLIVFGGEVPCKYPAGTWGPCYADDLWALSLDGEPNWTQLAPRGPRPAGRVGHSAVFDSIGNRVIVFGGVNSNVAFGDIWALTLNGDPSWNLLTPSGSLPPARFDHAAVLDPGRRKMIVFGGAAYGPGEPDDVWLLDLADETRWTKLAAAGSGPPEGPHAAVFDERGDRMLVVSGPAGPTWTLSFSGETAWVELPAPGDLPRMSTESAILDPRRERVIAYRGSDPPSLWAWDLGAPGWREFPRSRNAPEALWVHAAIYDPVRARMLTCGGRRIPDTPPWDPGVTDEIWALSLRSEPAWSLLDVAAPRPSGQAEVAIYDPVQDRMVMWGPCLSYSPDDCRDETWSLSLGKQSEWTRLETHGDSPDPSYPKLAAYDPDGRRMLVVRAEWSAGYAPTLHSLSLDGDHVWSGITTEGEVPMLRNGLGVFWDTQGHQLIVLDHGYGGLWTVKLRGDRAEWRAVPGSTRLGARIKKSLFDETKRRVIVFGWDSPVLYLKPWAFDLDDTTGWARGLTRGQGRPSRDDDVVVYDPVFDRAVFFGGSISISRGYSDAWALDLGPHVEEVAVDVKPGNAEDVVPLGSRGVTPIAILSSATFDADSVAPASVTLAGAPVRSNRGAVPQCEWRDVNGDGRADLIVHVETDELQLGPRDTVAILRGSTPSGRIAGFGHIRLVPAQSRHGAEETATAGLPAGLSMRAPSLVRPGAALVLDCSIAATAPARLELMDVMGRRVASRELDPFAGLRTRVELDEAHLLPPGLYLVRLSQAGHSATARTVILR
jgi:hypothetical protein